MTRILVTATSFGKHDPSLRTALEAEAGQVIYNTEGRPLRAYELIPLVAGIDGWIAGLDEIDASVIAAAKRLRVIARYGVGLDRVDVDTATQNGIVVTNTPGANAAAVAELTLGFMLALARHLCDANVAVRRGEWPRYAGLGLRGKTVGLVGLGAIGREVARRLTVFGCQILAVDPYLDREYAAQYFARLVTLSELLQRSDFVSLHAPVLPSTFGMVDREFLKGMKPGAFLINTARGELVDEGALLAALDSGHLAGAALDCFRREPPGADDPLLRSPKVIVTPHTGSHTDDATNQMGWMALRACLAVLKGERPEYIVNPEVFTQTSNELR